MFAAFPLSFVTKVIAYVDCVHVHTETHCSLCVAMGMNLQNYASPYVVKKKADVNQPNRGPVTFVSV